MPLTHRTRPGALADDVILTVSGVPAGRDWSVTGESEGASWVAASGTGTGRAAHVVDPLAPLQRATTYALDVDGSATGPVVRGAGTRLDLVTSADGRRAVPFSRAVEHEQSVTPRSYLYEVPGRVRPVAAFAPVARIGGEQLVVRVDAAHLRTMRDLLLENRPIVVLHNVCRLPGCDIPRGVRVAVTGAKGDLTGRLDAAERVWTLDVQEIDAPHGEATPAITWGDVLERFGTWQAVRASGLTWAQVAAGAWQQ